MSNRFCIILNEGNTILTFATPLQDKIYKIKQGFLFIGDRTPYHTFDIKSESWHIIGHIDNLPLLNYLLYSHYPSQHEVLSLDIICLAVKRYGMKIVELLQGNFCIVYEDAEGNLTLVTEKETQQGATKATNDAETERGGTGCPVVAGAPQDTHSKPIIPDIPAVKEANCAATACRYPQQSYNTQRKIAINRWNDNHLQFIQSVRYPAYCEKETCVMNDIKGKVIDL
ncbi:DUF1933 domain-containing protein [Sodalis ligni]|uniref:carbapenam-3-carboxylate synthase domain-containing protein n=1 Tax=Sodalis ligni TaxID=2697027 RepID=UPI00193F2964|nr:carbapenam-3-carboxylate synthase domain-containing protein [Sodalis ligni]QWA11926.1 DUF1933 domain-containing protein [Sodalis ligni]